MERLQKISRDFACETWITLLWLLVYLRAVRTGSSKTQDRNRLEDGVGWSQRIYRGGEMFIVALNYGHKPSCCRFAIYLREAFLNISTLSPSKSPLVHVAYMPMMSTYIKSTYLYLRPYPFDTAVDGDLQACIHGPSYTPAYKLVWACKLSERLVCALHLT